MRVYVTIETTAFICDKCGVALSFSGVQTATRNKWLDLQFKDFDDKQVHLCETCVSYEIAEAASRVLKQMRKDLPLSPYEIYIGEEVKDNEENSLCQD